MKPGRQLSEYYIPCSQLWLEGNTCNQDSVGHLMLNAATRNTASLPCSTSTRSYTYHSNFI